MDKEQQKTITKVCNIVIIQVVTLINRVFLGIHILVISQMKFTGSSEIQLVQVEKGYEG